MKENWHSENVAEQCNRLADIIKKHQDYADALNRPDAVLFWEGYRAMLEDIRYCGLILLADKLEERLKRQPEFI